jgi:HAD superfamily hydrolase (TIGR01509 family)
MATLRYVLWDNDGVLVDTEEGYFRATHRALAECGVDLDRARYMARRAQGLSSWDLPEVLALDPRMREQQRAARDAYYQQFIRGASREIPGVRGVLGELYGRYRMAIVTTSNRRNFELLHAEGSLLRHMEFALTREDFVDGKPSPDGYLTALERFGAAPDEAIVVEDSAQGLNAARAAGIRCVIVRNAFFRDAHAFDGAAHVLDSIVELPGAIATLARKV